MTPASGPCFHCGLPLPPGADFHAEVEGIRQPLCCAGCVAVTELIVASGLTAYYRFRDELPEGPVNPMADSVAELLRYDDPALQRSFVGHGADGSHHASLSLRGLRCAACVWLVEKHLRSQPGVLDAQVSLGSERAEVRWQEGPTRLSQILAAVGRLGYAAHPYRPDWREAERQEEYRSALRRLAVSGLGAMQVMMYAVGLYAGTWHGMSETYRDLLRLVSALVTTPIVFYAARPFFRGARRDLFQGRLGMDVPVALALALAYGASLWATVARTGEVYFESVGMFVFFLSIGRFVEMRARHRAQSSVEAAVRQPPETASRLVDGNVEEVSVYDLAPGDLVQVRPGATFPADGVVVEGEGWVNESMLTGEQWPRGKRPADPVTGGTQNGESPLVVRIDRTGGDTVLSAVRRLVDLAASARPELARLADRVAAVFVPAVLVTTSLVALYWWYHDPPSALWIALSVLVVTCPCALSLATPAALTAAAGGLLQRGVLVTRGAILETLPRVTHVVFDKTGTLTTGRFRIERTIPLRGAMAADVGAEACALETHSEHPIARAFADLGGGGEPASAVRVRAGQGVEGMVAAQRRRIGAPAWVESGFDRPTPAPPAREGHWVLLAGEEGPLAWFEIADTVRPEAAETVARLRRMGLKVEILSGDPSPAVPELARRFGLSASAGGVSPEGKLAHVRRLQEEGAVVLMVGDGINDAPVLGGSEVSVAMGGGTDLAKVGADAVLLHEDISVLPEALRHARRARRVMRQNLLWSLTYNLVVLPLAAAGWVTPWLAAIGMSLSSLVVVLNAVRLNRRPRPAASEIPSAWGRWARMGEASAS